MSFQIEPTEANFKTLIIIAHVANAVALAFVAQRLYTKLKVVGSLSIDDGTFIAAAIAMSCSVYYSLQGVNAGRRALESAPNYSDEHLDAIGKLYVIGATPLYIAFGFSKSTLILEYRRLSPTRRFQIITWCLLVFNAIYYIALTLGVYINPGAICQVPEDMWRWSNWQNNTCTHRTAILTYVTGLEVVLDFAICSVPLSVLINLRMRAKRKIGLMILFVSSSITFISGIIRLLYFRDFYESKAPYQDAWALWVAAVIENNLIVICPSLITFPKFIVSLAPNFLIFRLKSPAVSPPPVEKSPPARRVTEFGQWMGRDAVLTRRTGLGAMTFLDKTATDDEPSEQNFAGSS